MLFCFVLSGNNRCSGLWQPKCCKNIHWFFLDLLVGGDDERAVGSFASIHVCLDGQAISAAQSSKTFSKSHNRRVRMEPWAAASSCRPANGPAAASVDFTFRYGPSPRAIVRRQMKRKKKRLARGQPSNCQVAYHIEKIIALQLVGRAVGSIPSEWCSMRSNDIRKAGN